jgi:hypothetical protein
MHGEPRVRELWVSPDGLHVLIDGDTFAATTVDDVTTYDGTVVIQETVALAGFVSPVVSGGPDEVSMDAAGRWYARGNNADGQDWVVRNGVILAKTDDPIGATGERVVMGGPMNEAQETPPTGSPATGTIKVLVDTAANTLTYQINVVGLVNTETAAHIHGMAPPGVPAGILYALPLGNTKTGVINYLESEEPGILSGQTYVNVHTNVFGGGEIRGQILPQVETWDDATFADGFFAMTGNAAGDYLVAGLSNAPDAVNGVVVLNGSSVILREGDRSTSTATDCSTTTPSTRTSATTTSSSCRRQRVLHVHSARRSGRRVRARSFPAPRRQLATRVLLRRRLGHGLSVRERCAGGLDGRLRQLARPRRTPRFVGRREPRETTRSR